VPLRSPYLPACLAEAIGRELAPFKFSSGKVANYLKKCENETDNFAEKQEI